MRKTLCSNCGKEVWYPSGEEEVPPRFLPTHRNGHVFCNNRCGRKAITKGIVSGIDAYPFKRK